MNFAMSDKKISQLVMSEFLKERISQWVTPKRMNITEESCNEWVSLQTIDNHWNVMPSRIKFLCDEIIF